MVALVVLACADVAAGADEACAAGAVVAATCAAGCAVGCAGWPPQAAITKMPNAAREMIFVVFMMRIVLGI